MNQTERSTILGANWRLENTKSSVLEDANSPDAAGMYLVRNMHNYSKEIQEGSLINYILVGDCKLRKAKSVSSEVGEI